MNNKEINFDININRNVKTGKTDVQFTYKTVHFMAVFPCTLRRPMMLTLATVVGLFNLFQFIENRFCKG